MASMRPPCDEAVIRSVDAGSPCRAEARGWILAATILGSSMAFIDSTVVNVALPALQASFHATVVDVQWVVEVYGLLLAALILVGGSLGDLLGRRLMFIVGVAVFAVASMGCGVASNIQQLIVARGIQGVGAALLVPGSPRNHQRVLRRAKPRPGDRHMVWFHGDHHRGWSGAGRLAR